MTRALRLRPTRGPSCGSNDGFLLTETLATFVLSAFVLLGLVSGASMIVRAIDRSAARVQDVDDLGRTMAAISRELSGLKRARWSGEEPQSFVFRGGPNSLFFVRADHDDEGLGERRVVALREIVQGDGTVLMRSNAPFTSAARSFADLLFGPQQPLPTGSARLRFYYVAAPRLALPETPRVDSWPTGLTLPGAVIVEAVDAASGRLIVSRRFSVRVNADVGCVATPLGGLGRSPQREPAPDFCGRPDNDDKAGDNGASTAGRSL